MSQKTLIVGVGYLGQRFLDAAGDDDQGLTRADYDLDVGGDLPDVIPDDFDVLYTVPPSRGSSGDG